MRELTPDLYYLFREGMTLRKKDVIEIFGTDDLHFRYSGLIYKPHHAAFKGSAHLQYLMPEPVEYDIKRFIEKAPDIYNNGYKAGERPYAGLLDYLPPVDGKSQVYHGLMSGILKYNSARSFYFDEEGTVILDQYVEEEH